MKRGDLAPEGAAAIGETGDLHRRIPAGCEPTASRRAGCWFRHRGSADAWVPGRRGQWLRWSEGGRKPSPRKYTAPRDHRFDRRDLPHADLRLGDDVNPSRRQRGRQLGTLLRVLSGVTLLVVLVLVYRSGAPPPATADGGPAAALPAPAPPGAAPAPAPPPSPLPLQVAREIVQELTQRSTLAIDPRGNLVPAPDGELPAGYRQLLHPDPVYWGEILEQLPSLGRFHAWLLAGGEPEGLPEEIRTELARSDAICRRHGLPSPFHPFLYLTPQAEAVESAALLPPGLCRWLAIPERLTGWEATAALAWSRLQQRLPRLRETAARASMGEPVPEDIPQGIFGRALGIPVEFQDYVGGVFTVPENRAAIATWLVPVAAELRTFVYALSRAMRRTPADRDRLALLAEALLDHLEPVWFHHLAFADPEHWTGHRPTTPAAYFLHALIAQYSANPRQHAETDHQDMLRLAQRSWEQAMGEEPEPQAFASTRFARAFVQRTQGLSGPRHAQELHALFHAHRDRLLGCDERRLAGAMRQIGETWLAYELDPGPDEDDLLAVIEWLDGHPEAWRSEAERARARQLSESLLRGLENLPGPSG